MFGMLDRVHPDAVAEQRAAGLAPRRIDRDYRDPQLVLLVQTKAADNLVGERALARAAGAGDAEGGRRRLRRSGVQRDAHLLGNRACFEPRDQSRQCARAGEAIARSQRRQVRRQILGEVDVAGGDDLADHSLQPELLPILRREDPRHAVVLQLLDLGGHDHATATAEHLDVAAATLAQQLEHVLEELDVPTLIGRDRDAVCVLGQRAVDDLLDRAVVAEMDHLAAGRLQDPAHDVDRRVVPVEQRGRRDEADLVDRLVDERRTARIVHREAPPGESCPEAHPGDGKLTPRAFAALEGPPTLHDVYVNVKANVRPSVGVATWRRQCAWRRLHDSAHAAATGEPRGRSRQRCVMEDSASFRIGASLRIGLRA